MPGRKLRVPTTRSVIRCVTTRSVGTIKDDQVSFSVPAFDFALLHEWSSHHKTRLGCRLNAGGAEWAERHGCRESRPRPWMADGGGPMKRRRSEGTTTKESPNLEQAPLVTWGAFPSNSPKAKQFGPQAEPISATAIIEYSLQPSSLLRIDAKANPPYSPTGLNTTTANGGKSSASENGWPWLFTSSATTAPPLPIFEPAYTPASEFSSSAHFPLNGTPTR